MCKVSNMTKNGSTEEAKESAQSAGLIYVSRERPGIARRRAGKGFQYLNPNGKRVRKQETILRIQQLVIPPAWSDVWICSSSRGHIQAVGKDARGRTQYRYHAKWREVRDESKYGKMVAFGKALPKIRSRVRRHLRLPELPREKVLATIIKLLEITLIRVGNEEYAKSNKSFGLTTIHNNHVNVNGSKVRFQFKGKSSVQHTIDIQDKRLAKVIRTCQELPEQELFEYVDPDGSRHDITSSDVNGYLQEITGEDFTAKDFRNWAGTILAAVALQEFEAFKSEAQAKRNIVAAIEAVAKKLGNTKAVCRKCYIHPVILEVYMQGSLAKALKQATARSALRLEENAVLQLLQAQLKS
jgi:DNA topoisomerase I